MSLPLIRLPSTERTLVSGFRVTSRNTDGSVNILYVLHLRQVAYL